MRKAMRKLSGNIREDKKDIYLCKKKLETRTNFFCFNSLLH